MFGLHRHQWLGIFPVLMTLSLSVDAELAQSKQSQLLELLHQDCGSCHGLNLTGGLGPSLTATALRDKPDAYLFEIISNGRPGTPMPPWKNQLAVEEIQWLIGTLRKPEKP